GLPLSLAVDPHIADTRKRGAYKLHAILPFQNTLKAMPAETLIADASMTCSREKSPVVSCTVGLLRRYVPVTPTATRFDRFCQRLTRGASTSALVASDLTP